MHSLWLCLLSAGFWSADPTGTPVVVKVHDDRLQLQLFAEHPQIVTPTGIDIDAAGRIWALESNTHFPPEGYQGHPSDRLLIFQDQDGDGRAEAGQVFADGLKHSMSVAVRPTWLLPGIAAPEQQVYVATRREIVLLIDKDGNGTADERKTLVHLETKGDYPHNGLAGMAFDPTGWMYFGFGENLGADYKIIGVDGASYSGGGEGGNIYRCRPDGTQLTHWATGFWNPHASCVDAFGRLFTVDNDPDSRPPCRLLQIIPHGDYGYRFRNGRKGLHPFTAWNGELPGTLPMVAGTGEAPSGIVAYESDGFPDEYRGNLLVGSWGDHRIDRFRLHHRGSSFSSIAEPVLSGNENFRPVGLTVAPDGSLYFTDWVLREYKLHGHGRIWRLSAKQPPAQPAIDVTTITAAVPQDQLTSWLQSPRLSVRRQAAAALAQTQPGQAELIKTVTQSESSIRARCEAFWALVRVATADPSLELPVAPQGKEAAVTATGPDFDSPLTTAVLWWMAENRLEQGSETLQRLSSLVIPDEISPAKIAGVKDPLVWPALVAARRKGDFLIPDEQLSTLHEHDPFVQSAVIQRLSQLKNFDSALNAALVGNGRLTNYRKLWALAARRVEPRNAKRIGTLWHSTNVDQETRRVLLQWIAEEQIKELRPLVEKLLESPDLTADQLLASIATLEMLDGVPPAEFDKTPAAKYVLPILQKPSTGPSRAAALRLVEPDDPALPAELFKSILASQNSELRLEAVRTLQQSTLPHTLKLLMDVAFNDSEPERLRAEAVVGLSRFVADKEALQKMWPRLLTSPSRAVRLEAERGLRALDPAASQALLEPVAKSWVENNDVEAIRQLKRVSPPLYQALAADVQQPVLPPTAEAWLKVWDQLTEESRPDEQAGRRTFFHPLGAGCFKCHTIDGRGGRIGPDLTHIASTMNREKLLQSILEPSREIAPQFIVWTFELSSGQTVTGTLLASDPERVRIGQADGKILDIPAAEIENRVAQNVSLMPNSLVEQLTVGEVLDLIAFLETLR